MPAVYVIEPEDNGFLAALHPDPCLKEVQIESVEIRPAQRKWVIYLKGCQQGVSELWTSLDADLRARCESIDAVEFVWLEAVPADATSCRFDEASEEPEPSAEDRDDYMAQIIQRFPGPKTAVSSAPTENGSGVQASSGRRKRRSIFVPGPVSGETVALRDVREGNGQVAVVGEILDIDLRETRSGSRLLLVDIYDGTDSLTCKAFLNKEEALPEAFAKGAWIQAAGRVEHQDYEQELALMIREMAPGTPPVPLVDQAAEKRVEFHLHTKMSNMDGTIDVQDAIAQAANWGHAAVAITDHGVVQAFPDAYIAGQTHGIKILYGTEGYLLNPDDDRLYHILIIAQNAVGLKHLYQLVSEAHLHHFYRKPRIPRERLEACREGLLLGTACEAGELYQAVLRKDERAEHIARFYDFLEIQPLANNQFLVGTERVSGPESLIELNRAIVHLGQTLGIPVIATGDVHFLRPEDAVTRTILLAGQGFEDAEHQSPLYFRTTEDMLKEFDYLSPALAREVVIENPSRLADSVDDLIPVPQELHTPVIEQAEERLEKTVYDAAHERYGQEMPTIVSQRIEKELKAIVSNGYASLYWIAQKVVRRSLADGYLVGSRGSVGSSLVATLCGITEVNPLPPHYACPQCQWSRFFSDGRVGCGVDLPDDVCPECGTPMQKLGFDIPFEVFMGFYGDKVPDIDLNFSGEYQGRIHRYTEELFGSDNVFRAGTIGTLAEKTAYGFVKKYYDQLNQDKRSAEINRLVRKLTGVRRTTGQHAGGLMVVPEGMDVYDFTPVQYPANDSARGIITTHFDCNSIHESMVKLDLLGHSDATKLRLLEQFTGIHADAVALDDPETISLFSGLEALGVTEKQIGTPVGMLGIPEFGTSFVRQIVEELRPTTFADLVRIMGLCHGTNVWVNNSQDLVRDKMAKFDEIIACRDDIMLFLLEKGLEDSHAFTIMESVRKGRGLTEDDLKAMKEVGVPGWYIESCQRISYLFPKAHAVAYAMMAFRVAYFKVHFPAAFYATYLSIAAEEIDIDLLLKGEKGIRQQIGSIIAKGNDATAKEKGSITILEVVLEALARGIRIQSVDLYQSHDRHFQVVEDGALRPPLAALQGVGVTAASNIVKARQEKERFSSIEDLRQRAKITKPVVEVLRKHGCLEGMSQTNQLTLF